MNVIKMYCAKGNNELFKIENYKDKVDFKLIIKVLLKEAFNEEDEDEIGDIDYLGDFDKEHKVLYAYTSSDATITIVDNLDKFSEGYRTEEEWGVETWEQI